MAKTAEEKEVKDMNELVEIELPLTREKQKDVFVGLNGMTLQIKRGERVKIPLWAKEILDNKEAMEREAFRRNQSKPRR